jgi:hypothetical protein
MDSNIPRVELRKYFFKLSIDEKVALLPKELREPFCQDVLTEFYKPYWNRMKNSQNKTSRLTDEDITIGRERVLKKRYLPNKKYKEAIIEQIKRDSASAN